VRAESHIIIITVIICRVAGKSPVYTIIVLYKYVIPILFPRDNRDPARYVCIHIIYNILYPCIHRRSAVHGFRLELYIHITDCTTTSAVVPSARHLCPIRKIEIHATTLISHYSLSQKSLR